MVAMLVAAGPAFQRCGESRHVAREPDFGACGPDDTGVARQGRGAGDSSCQVENLQSAGCGIHGEPAGRGDLDVAGEGAGDGGPVAEEERSTLEHEFVRGVSELRSVREVSSRQDEVAQEVAGRVGQGEAPGAARGGDVGSVLNDHSASRGAGDLGGEIVVEGSRGVDRRVGVAVGAIERDGIGGIRSDADVMAELPVPPVMILICATVTLEPRATTRMVLMGVPPKMAVFPLFHGTWAMPAPWSQLAMEVLHVPARKDEAPSPLAAMLVMPPSQNRLVCAVVENVKEK